MCARVAYDFAVSVGVKMFALPALLAALVCFAACAQPQQLFQPDAAIDYAVGDLKNDAAVGPQTFLRPIRSERADMHRPATPHREPDARVVDGGIDSK